MLRVKTGQASEVVFGRKTPPPPTSRGGISEGGLLGTPATTVARATPIYTFGTTSATSSGQASPGWDLFGPPAVVATPSNLGGAPAATTTTATGASEGVGTGSFSETAPNPLHVLGEASVEKLFEKPLARCSSVLKESVQYFVLGAELEMEGLELSSYV